MGLFSSTWRSPYARIIFLLFVTAVWPTLIWFGYLSLTPFGQIGTLTVEVDGGQPQNLQRVVYVHAGDILNTQRSIFVTEPVYAEIDRVFNNADPGKRYALPLIGQLFSPGLNVFTPNIKIPSDITPWTVYSFETALVDFKHNPVQLPDFRLCILPPSTPIPKPGVILLCRNPAAKTPI